MLWEKCKSQIQKLKKSFMVYVINDRVSHTFGRGGAYFSWKERILVVLILTGLLVLILFAIIYYPLPRQ